MQPTGPAWVLLKAEFEIKLGAGSFCRADGESWNEEAERDVGEEKGKRYLFLPHRYCCRRLELGPIGTLYTTCLRIVFLKTKD